MVAFSNGPGIGDWHSASSQASTTTDRKASSSKLPDTPRALMTNDPPAHGALSSDDGRDVINCNSSFARLAGSRLLMALPSTVTKIQVRPQLQSPLAPPNPVSAVDVQPLIAINRIDVIMKWRELQK